MASTWPAEAAAAEAASAASGGSPAAQRVLPRLPEMLLRQREKFRQYLKLLDGQERAILAEDVEGVEAYVRLASFVLQEIRDLGRVIGPLDALYTDPPGAELKCSLDRLRAEAAARNRNNCRLLAERMESLRARIRGLAHPRGGACPYARLPDPALVDISL